MVSSLPTQTEQPKRRSNDPISWYLQNIGRVPLLTPAEEIELGNQVQKMMILTEDGQLNEKLNDEMQANMDLNNLIIELRHKNSVLDSLNKELLVDLKAYQDEKINLLETVDFYETLMKNETLVKND